MARLGRLGAKVYRYISQRFLQHVLYGTYTAVVMNEGPTELDANRRCSGGRVASLPFCVRKILDWIGGPTPRMPVTPVVLFSGATSSTTWLSMDVPSISTVAVCRLPKADPLPYVKLIGAPPRSTLCGTVPFTSTHKSLRSHEIRPSTNRRAWTHLEPVSRITVKGTPPTVLHTQKYVSPSGYSSEEGAETYMFVEYSLAGPFPTGSVKLPKARRRRLGARAWDLIVVGKRRATAKSTAKKAESANARSERRGMICRGAPRNSDRASLVFKFSTSTGRARVCRHAPRAHQ
jgi:hypothetical protein